ncbi:hypothetical protein E4K72_18100 [Oxalobacteraceae bacterium OM1]|nr:hypothetical protein E4K72_18100 [Oxalobacteraceae bacterium OM1]
MSKTTQRLITSIFCTILAACGGGGSDSGTTAQGTNTTGQGTTTGSTGTTTGTPGTGSTGTSTGTSTGSSGGSTGSTGGSGSGTTGSGGTTTTPGTGTGTGAPSSGGTGTGTGTTTPPAPTPDATQARFNGPTGITFAANGDLYIADSGNFTVRKLAANGAVTTIAGKAGVQGSADGTGTNALFTSPRGIAVDSAGNLYVTDGSVVRRITPTGAVTTIAGRQGEFDNLDGVGAAARFRTPDGIVIDSAGTLYVADSNTYNIRKINPATGAVTTLAGGNGTTQIDGTGAQAGFVGPTALAIDAANNIYVADMSVAPGTTPIPLRGSSFLRKVTPAGVVTTVAGNLGHTTPANDTVPRTQLAFSSGLAVDADGTAYLTDHFDGGNFVKVVRPDGTVSTRVQDTSSISFLSRLAYNPTTRRLYGTDESNDTIVWLTTASDGAVTVVAGKRGEAGSADTP